jgi:integrase
MRPSVSEIRSCTSLRDDLSSACPDIGDDTILSFVTLPHLVQRSLGHASLRTTGIYGDVMGPEERAFAARMWRNRINGAISERG